MISRKERLLRIVAQESKFLIEHGVEEIGVFGSVVRGEDTGESDLDLLVTFAENRKNFRNFLTLINFLEDRLECPVDLVTRESLSPHLGPHILKEVENVPLAS